MAALWRLQWERARGARVGLGSECRAHRHHIISWLRKGTVMRHFLLSRAIAPGSRSVVETTTMA
jgi:hypothetical protein